MRKRPEWDKTDKPNAVPPQWVYERKFLASGGKCEGPCGRLLGAADKWDLDHIKRVRDLSLIHI